MQRRFAPAPLVLLLLATPAAAAEPEQDQPARSGAYAAVAFSAAGLVSKTDEQEHSRPAWGVRGCGGQRISDWLAAEAEVEWLDHALRRPGRGKTGGDTLALTTNVRGYFPRWGSGQFYSLVGIGLLRADFSSPSSSSSLDRDATEFAARFGVGVDVDLGRHLGLEIGASYVLPTGALESFDYLSGGLGLLYRF